MSHGEASPQSEASPLYMLVGYYSNSSSNIPTIYIFGIYLDLDECREYQKKICGENYKKNTMLKTISSKWDGYNTLITWIKKTHMGNIHKPVHLSNTMDIDLD